MKLLAIAPPDIAERISDIVRNTFPSITLYIEKYIDYRDAPQIVDRYNGKVDAILFGGKSPFRLCEETRSEALHSVLYERIPRHERTLIKALFCINYVLKKDIRFLSLDTYTHTVLDNLFSEIGINPASTKIYYAEQRYLENDYNQYLLEFHRNNFYNNKVSCCVTGILPVYEELQKERIPSVLTKPTDEIILHTIKNLQTQFTAKQNSENQIAIVAVKMAMPSTYSVVKEDEYTFTSNRIKLLDKLYAFSYRVDGVVEEHGFNEFLIFTTKKILETETNDFKKLSLLDALEECLSVDVYIGIGYGKTANGSKQKAFEGISLAQNYGGNTAFVIFENGEQIGPLFHSSTSVTTENYDERFNKISLDTGISINTIYKIYSNIAKTGKLEYTSKELAKLCDINYRSMDRIILKLCDTGYCEIQGKMMMKNHGRPSRILKFNSLMIPS